jgi:hypothetical protein
MTDRSRATEALLQCLSGSCERSAVGREPAPAWNEVIEIAADAGLAPLLFKRLKQSDARACVPVDVWKRLRETYLASAGESTRLFRELESVLRCLRSSGIRVIVLKGAHLAEAVYGDVALRPMHDVDLMVLKADLRKAEAVLLDMGRVHQPTEDIELWCVRKHHLPSLTIRDLAVELHWTLVSPAGPIRVDAPGLWDRAQPANVAGVEVLSLSPEDLLLHLCLHFCYQHGCVGLRYLCDIAETTHRFRGDMDWAQLVKRARAWRASRYASLVLHLARSLLGASVPDDVLGRLIPGGLDQRLLKKATECVLAQKRYEPDDDWALLPFPNQLGDKSTRERVKAFWDVVILSREGMALRYPRARDSRHLWPYYVLRPADLLRKYGRATLRQGFRMIHVPERERPPSLARWLRLGKP